MAMHAQSRHHFTGEGYHLRPALQPIAQFRFNNIPVQRPKPRWRVTALPPALQKKCDEWLSLNRDSDGIDEAKRAIDAGDERLLQDALGERLVFGQCIH